VGIGNFQGLPRVSTRQFSALNRDEPHGFLFTFNKMSYTSRATVVFSDEGGEKLRGVFEKA
jgi:hypothetical protein